VELTAISLARSTACEGGQPPLARAAVTAMAAAHPRRYVVKQFLRI